MTVSPLIVANTILEHSFRDERLITPMELQKFLALSAEFYENIYGESLFEEVAQCWAYGPVFYSVHDKFSCFSGKSITRYGKRLLQDSHVTNDGKIVHTVGIVWNKYKNYSKNDLVHVVRREGGPWDKAYQSASLTVNFKC